jgi:hypothetical protein
MQPFSIHDKDSFKYLPCRNKTGNCLIQEPAAAVDIKPGEESDIDSFEAEIGEGLGPDRDSPL